MSAMFNGLRVTNKNKRNHGGKRGLNFFLGGIFHGNIWHVQKGGKNIGTTHKTDDWSVQTWGASSHVATRFHLYHTPHEQLHNTWGCTN